MAFFYTFWRMQRHRAGWQPLSQGRTHKFSPSAESDQSKQECLLEPGPHGPHPHFPPSLAPIPPCFWQRGHARFPSIEAFAASCILPYTSPPGCPVSSARTRAKGTLSPDQHSSLTQHQDSEGWWTQGPADVDEPQKQVKHGILDQLIQVKEIH